MAEFTVSASEVIDAKPAEVWEKLMDVKSWPEWKPFIKYTKIKSGYENMSCGTVLKMGIRPSGVASVPVTVTVSEFNRPARLAWEGGVKGLVHACHSFDLEDKGGKTKITSSETFAGALVPVVKLLVTLEDFEKLHQDWVKAVKERLEGKSEEPAEEDHGH